MLTLSCQNNRRVLKTTTKTSFGLLYLLFFLIGNTVDGWNFVGYQFSWFSWRVRSTNSSTLEMVIFFMNYEWKYYGHEFWTPRVSGWVNWLFNVTINDISVIYVTAHRCAGGLNPTKIKPSTIFNFHIYSSQNVLHHSLLFLCILNFQCLWNLRQW